ncbi:hypothetical protein TRIP_E230066 [uncultured Spirochaetota bacterium]|nr:hypothetical protein TRIP_E230066 [uncultured Spirochaetota bacterium]
MYLIYLDTIFYICFLLIQIYFLLVGIHLRY